MTALQDQEVVTPAELETRLRAIGAERYHHRHPFHQSMHEGKLTRGQLQAWALNRYYYQSVIPIKDAIILSRSEDPAFRRAWRKRVIDHDGDGIQPGGIEKWILLAQATGLDREQVTSERGILPGVKFAVNAYLELVSKHSFLEAVASSLSELFSRDLIALRVDRIRGHYSWFSGGLTYVYARLKLAPEVVTMPFAWVTDRDLTRARQVLVWDVGLT